MKKTISLYIIVSLLTGCATSNESLLTGAMIGGTAGTVLGHQHKGNSKGRMTGAIVGTALGGLVGYLSHKNKKKKRAKKSTVREVEMVKINDNPFLTKPKVTMYWEPDKIEGDKFIEKHRVWVLKNGSQWSKKR